jgi:hypothetical protein
MELVSYLVSIVIGCVLYVLCECVYVFVWKMDVAKEVTEVHTAPDALKRESHD